MSGNSSLGHENTPSSQRKHIQNKGRTATALLAPATYKQGKGGRLKRRGALTWLQTERADWPELEWTRSGQGGLRPAKWP